MSYGLTKNQTKVLSVLIQNNTCFTVKQISQVSNIARESIYKILLNLREKGLIEKSILKPEKYCSVSLKRVLIILQEEKNREDNKLKELTTYVLLENQQKSNINYLFKNNNTQFILIPKKKQLVNKLNLSYSKCKKSIRIATSWKRFLQGISIYENQLKKLINKGIKVKVIITRKSPKKKIPKESIFFQDLPNVSIKFNNNAPELILAIIDDLEVFLMTKPKADIEESPALWSNNKSLINGLIICYDSLWEKIKNN